jgi:hypothetical protein
MLILSAFFEELINIQLLKTSIIDNTINNNHEIYSEYLNKRLDFTKKYERIMRGIDLLTDEQYTILHDYFSGKIISGKNKTLDTKILKMITDCENAI